MFCTPAATRGQAQSVKYFGFCPLRVVTGTEEKKKINKKRKTKLEILLGLEVVTTNRLLLLPRLLPRKAIVRWSTLRKCITMVDVGQQLRECLISRDGLVNG
jgi:hypothetical protein